MTGYPRRLVGKPLSAASLSLAAALSVLWFLSGCLPAVSEDPENRIDPADLVMSRQAYAEMVEKFPVYAGPVIPQLVQTVGERLAARVSIPANSKLVFEVLDSPGVFAHSFAHGRIVISRGLVTLFNSEAQLAAVLAHEIGHVVALHPSRYLREARNMRELEMRLAARMGRQEGRDALRIMGLARVRGYSREHELEADDWSERLLERAGYDVGATTQVLRLLLQVQVFHEKLGFELWDLPESGSGGGVFATHPSLEHRLAQARARQGRAALNPAKADPSYLRALQDMPYGLPERMGIQYGREYVHPAARVTFTLPAGWYLFSVRNQLIAAPRGQDGLLMIRFASPEAGENRRQALDRLAGGYTLETVVTSTPATVMAAGWKQDGTDRRQARFAIVDAGTKRLQVAGFTYLPDSWAKADARFQELVNSIRTLPEGKHLRARASRVKIADSVMLATHVPGAKLYGEPPAERWQLLNQLFPDQRLPAGHPAKILE